MHHLSLIVLLLLLPACTGSQDPKLEPSVIMTTSTEQVEIATPVVPQTVGEIALPAGYLRQASADSFAAYLRNLPLKPPGSPVTYYNGRTKPNNDVYDYVIDLPIGNRDLHQCADAVMRLRAEYLWNSQQYDRIHFNFTNGFRVDYTEWMKGHRMVIDGNKTYWNNRSAPSNTYADFWKYLELIFAYAGTASLEKELNPKNIADAAAGDVLIKGGFPGHAVIILDQAVHAETGAPIFLLGQSYMPAQELQVLANPFNPSLGSWYQLKPGTIDTPEWRFDSKQLRAFTND